MKKNYLTPSTASQNLFPMGILMESPADPTESEHQTGTPGMAPGRRVF